ncbi:MAG: hypothetical protein ACO3JG_10235 [Luteolibacter sp.]
MFQRIKPRRDAKVAALQALIPAREAELAAPLRVNRHEAKTHEIRSTQGLFLIVVSAQL